MDNVIKGRIHSIETFGAVDGPGIRYVLFLQGCPLKCLYCHNPDSWDKNSGKVVSSEEIAKNIKSYKNFIKTGGVTFSGGEPMLQTEFIEDVILRIKEVGIHTAIDTSGSVPLKKCKNVIDISDMLLLDIKSIDDDVCKKLTGMSNENALEILDYCEKINKPVWIRHVLVPGITLDYDMLEKMAKYLSKYKCIENIELLAFHKMGEFKWKEMNMEYTLYDTREPTKDEISKVKEIFTSKNLTVKI